MLGQTLSWDEAALDELVLAREQTHMLLGLRGHPQAPLCYPSHGFFGIPVRRQSGSFATIYAIPLTEHFAVASAPRDVREDDILQTITCGTGGLFTNCSVGITPSRVIIHPSVMQAYGAATSAQMIEEARKVVRERFSLCAEINELDRRMGAIALGI